MTKEEKKEIAVVIVQMTENMIDFVRNHGFHSRDYEKFFHSQVEFIESKL